ncbi:MFS transporter [Streptomyces sp. NBC_01264]|nr:MFS transporter [Streptomyces sp. NBC_01264]
MAWNAQNLIGFRVVQGLGGGLMLPRFSTMIMQAASGRALGRTMSIVTLPFVVGPIAGPVIGGLLLNRLDWRWLFWVNVPFFVVGFVLARRMLDPDAPDARPRVDTAGWLLLSPSLIAILLGLTNSSQAGGFGRPDSLAPLLAGVLLLLIFTLHSVRRPTNALVSVRLLTHRPLASAAASMFLSGAALYGGMTLLPLYWQQVRGADALQAGLLVAPLGIGALLSRPMAGGLSDKIGARTVAFTGFGIVGLSTVPFALATTTTDKWFLMAVLVVRGFGLAAVSIPLQAAAFVGLRRDQIPHAGIITRIAQQVGGAFGVAVLAVILDTALRRHAGSADQRAHAFDQAFWWAVGFTGLSLVLSLLLPGRTSTEPAEQPETATSPATV